MGSVRIECGDIYLRPLRTGDLAAVMEALLESQDAIEPVMPWAHDLTPARELRFIRESQLKRRLGIELAFGIFRTADRRYLGGVGLHQISRLNRRAELGYWVRSGCHRRGVARAAAARLLLLAVDELDLTSVQVRAATFNRRSLGLIRGLGFRRVGRIRRDLYADGRPHDTFLFDMLAEEVRSQRVRLERMSVLRLE